MANLNTQSLVALNESVTASPLDNFGTVGVVVAGTWSGTLSFYGSLDGVNFVSILAQNISTNAFSASATANGQYIINASGMFAIKVQMTAYTSGTADITVSATSGVTLSRSLSTISGGLGVANQAEVVSRADNSQALATQSEIAGRDSLGTWRKASTKVRSDGLTAVVTDATVVVESTFGFDQQPDSFFQVINTGGAGTTWTLLVKGTANDPSAPDRDVPDYTKVFTVQASEVGDELKFRDRIIQELNADTTFRNTVYLRANRATDRAVVHISSDKYSASGEFYERPNAGDFNVTIGGAPGNGVVVVGFDNLISRSKPVTISRDTDSPHRLGLFGVTGTVNVTSKELADLYVQEAMYSGSSDLRVNGSVTPVDFLIMPTTTQVFIEHLIFNAQANGVQFGKFLGQNTALTNGVLVTIKSDNVVTNFPIIKSTEDFKNKWAALSGDGANFKVDLQAGRDEMLAILSLPNPFLMRESGAFGAGNDDYIRIRIQDNLSAGLQDFRFRVKGFEKEP
jgi:hypothetical protein